MKHNLYKKQNGGAAGSALANIVTGVAGALDNNGSAFASKKTAAYSLSTESFNDTETAELNTAVESLSHALESIGQTHFSDTRVQLTDAQIQAATVAGVMTGDLRSAFSAKQQNVVSTENLEVISASGADVVGSRIPAMESYDDRDTRTNTVFTVAYNMQSARQDELGETFFPTVVISPDQPGYVTSIRIVNVYDEVRRSVTGSLNDFKKRNIIQAVIDPTILRNNQTKIVPVARAGTEAYFVSSTDIAPAAVMLDGESIVTAPLAIGKKFSLLGISQTDALLSTGIMDSSDSVDTAVTLSNLFLKVTNGGDTDIVRFGTASTATSVFAQAMQGNTRRVVLNFETTSLQVGAATKTATGGPLVALAGVGSYSVRLAVSVNGAVNLELGDTELTAGSVTVVSVTSPAGDVLSLASGQGQTIAALFANASIIGYNLDAFRSNLNRRQRGQLLETTKYDQLYMIPLLSPITCPRPLGAGDVNDTSDLAALITATHVRTSNSAVETLIRAADLLKEYVNLGDSIDRAPSVLGVSRFLVTPYYKELPFDARLVVDSFSSQNRQGDLTAAITSFLRDAAVNAHRASGYAAADSAMSGGGEVALPTVIIATDPVIAQYIRVVGDTRTFGDFPVKVVSTLDSRMKGKVFMSFGNFTNGATGTHNPLHFGNMAWKPEATVVIPMTRNGQISKELTVQPSFLHIVNLPVLVKVDVIGLTEVLSAKVTVNNHPV